MVAEPNRRLQIFHDSKCKSFDEDKQLCECAYASVISLTNALNWLTDQLIDARHKLSYAKFESGPEPIMSEPVRQKLRESVFQEMDRVAKKMLQNYEAQTK